MDFDRTRALGRWSEWVGESAVSQDILMRRLGIGRAARADLNVTSPPAQAMVSAHTAGINYYLSTLKEDVLPVEYKLAEKGVPDDWEDWHTFAHYASFCPFRQVRAEPGTPHRRDRRRGHDRRRVPCGPRCVLDRHGRTRHQVDGHMSRHPACQGRRWDRGRSERVDRTRGKWRCFLDSSRSPSR